ncbi:GDP-mannose transporter GONST5 [Penicillium rolfsii]|nr:GDP-mannose transporter GONST5 [Penicillium rolfsii]
MSYSKHEDGEVGMSLLTESSPRGSTSSRAGEDLEANNKEMVNSSPVELEYQTPIVVKYGWLSALLLFGMLLTVHNKFILEKFPCPWLLTGIHSIFSGLGTLLLLKLGYFKLSKLSTRDHLVLIAYSVLFSVNIFFSNYSLSLVSLAFFQIVRNTSPIFTVLMERLLFARSYSLATYIALVPIVLGAAITASGDFKFTIFGSIVSIIGVLLGVLKIIVTNRLMTGSLALPSLELIYRMSIYASIQTIVIGLYAGELSNLDLSTFWNTDGGSTIPLTSTAWALFGNGLLAFFLNISSFQANKVAGSLAITVWGNVRQTLTLILGILFLGDFDLNLQTGAGIVLVVVGCAFYSKAELDSKKDNRG